MTEQVAARDVQIGDVLAFGDQHLTVVRADTSEIGSTVLLVYAEKGDRIYGYNPYTPLTRLRGA